MINKLDSQVFLYFGLTWEGSFVQLVIVIKLTCILGHVYCYYHVHMKTSTPNIIYS